MLSKRHLLLFLLLILLVLQLMLFQSALANQIRIAWDAAPGATGCEVYYGTASKAYGLPIPLFLMVLNIEICHDLSGFCKKY